MTKPTTSSACGRSSTDQLIKTNDLFLRILLSALLNPGSPTSQIPPVTKEPMTHRKTYSKTKNYRFLTQLQIPNSITAPLVDKVRKLGFLIIQTLRQCTQLSCVAVKTLNTVFGVCQVGLCLSHWHFAGMQTPCILAKEECPITDTVSLHKNEV